jgi:hypothetical protein
MGGGLNPTAAQVGRKERREAWALRIEHRGSGIGRGQGVVIFSIRLGADNKDKHKLATAEDSRQEHRNSRR